jgi:hypothetical protein
MNRNTEKNLIDWLLEPNDIGVRYLALRDLSSADAKVKLLKFWQI